MYRDEQARFRSNFRATMRAKYLSTNQQQQTAPLTAATATPHS